MSARLLAVNARDPEEIRVALAADGRLLDLRCARAEHATMVGNLYLGVVRQVEPGLDAAFVDFGAGRAGFLHVGNVHPACREAPDDPFAAAAAPAAAAAAVAEGDAPPPEARIEELLRSGQRLLVQVLRDPARGKGATLSTYVAMPGRLLVWLPSLGRPAVSRRIEDEDERRRLRALLAETVPAGAGVIARTAAVGASAVELRRDFEHLQRRWQALPAAAAGGGPRLLAAEPSAPVRAVRDLYGPETARVIVDDEAVARELDRFFAEYLGAPAPARRGTRRRTGPVRAPPPRRRRSPALFRDRTGRAPRAPGPRVRRRAAAAHRRRRPPAAPASGAAGARNRGATRPRWHRPRRCARSPPRRPAPFRRAARAGGGARPRPRSAG